LSSDFNPLHICFIFRACQRLKSRFILKPMPKTPAPAAAAVDLPSHLSYEAALRELENLVSSMESGLLPLDDLLSGYQRGAALLQLCRDKLAAVEQQIKQVDAKNAGLE
jgi:exodeoxyribonuclease VII small subunit